MTATDKDMFEKVFTEWGFTPVYAEGEKAKEYVVKPWSIAKTKRAMACASEIVGIMKQTVDNMNWDDFFRLHLDVVFSKCFDPLCKLVLLTLDENESFFELIDNAQLLEVLHVIYVQNFTGDRVRLQTQKFLSTEVEPGLGEIPGPRTDSLLASLFPGDKS